MDSPRKWFTLNGFLLLFAAALLIIFTAMVLILSHRKETTWISGDGCAAVKWSRGSLPIPVYIAPEAAGWAQDMQAAMKLWDPDGYALRWVGEPRGLVQGRFILILSAEMASETVIGEEKPHAHPYWNAQCGLEQVDLYMPATIPEATLRKRVAVHEVGHGLGFDDGHSWEDSPMYKRQAIVGRWGIRPAERQMLHDAYGVPVPGGTDAGTDTGTGAKLWPPRPRQDRDAAMMAEEER